MTAEFEPRSEEGAGAKVLRLSVLLATTTGNALKFYMQMNDVSVTEAIRRAISLLSMHQEAQLNGDRLMLASGTGDDTVFRDITISEPE